MPTLRTLLQKKEARKRNLQFHILASVALNPNMRLVKLDSSYIGLIEIHDEYCKSRGFGREEPTLLWQEKLRAYYKAKGLDANKEDEIPIKEIQHVRLETKAEVETKYIPRTVLSNVSATLISLSFLPLIFCCLVHEADNEGQLLAVDDAEAVHAADSHDGVPHALHVPQYSPA